MDKESLFRPRHDTPSGMPEDDALIPGLGMTVRVRGLNRIEAMHVQLASGDPAEGDRRIVAQGMIDPVLVVPGVLHEFSAKPCKACAEVGDWQRVSLAEEIEVVTEAIARLSGMVAGNDKETYKSFRGESGPGVRTLPSAETLDDSGGTADTDE